MKQPASTEGKPVSGAPARATFRTTVQLNGKTATGIEVPSEAVASLGTSKKPAVRVTINGHMYRSTVATMGGVFMLPISAEQRAKAGVAAGDQVEVKLELDLEPRTVALPEDLQAALAGKAGALAAFSALAPSMRNEHIRQVNEAKAQETRERRIAKIVANLK